MWVKIIIYRDNLSPLSTGLIVFSSLFEEFEYSSIIDSLFLIFSKGNDKYSKY